MGPPASQEEYQQRVQGWTSALGELVKQPEIAVALLQMGTALGSGRTGPEAISEGFGAMGRAGAIREKQRQQGLGEEALLRKEGREDRRLGLEERELGAREKLWEMQARNYERMARGGGGGGGGAGAGDASMSTDQAKAMYEQCLQIPGSTPQSCMAAVQKKMYGLTPSQYVGGAESPYAAKLDQDRLADLERRQDDLHLMGKELSREDLEELNRLKTPRRGGPAQTAAPTAPAAASTPVATSAPTADRPRGYDRLTLAEAVQKGTVGVGDAVPLIDGTMLKITPENYAKLKAERTGGF
jgi:hypothetical protein